MTSIPVAKCEADQARAKMNLSPVASASVENKDINEKNPNTQDNKTKGHKTKEEEELRKAMFTSLLYSIQMEDMEEETRWRSHCMQRIPLFDKFYKTWSEKHDEFKLETIKSSISHLEKVELFLAAAPKQHADSQNPVAYEFFGEAWKSLTDKTYIKCICFAISNTFPDASREFQFQLSNALVQHISSSSQLSQ